MNRMIFAITLAFAIGCGGEGGGGSDSSPEVSNAEGLTLYTPMTQEGSFLLVNREGETVHEWTTGQRTGMGRLLADGSIVVLLDALAKPGTPSLGTPLIAGLDWDGNTLWEYKNDQLHHDVCPLPNGNVLAILWEQMTPANRARVTPAKSGAYYSDVIVEIDPASGAIAWEWHAQDEMVIENYTASATSNEFTHANGVEYLPEGNPFNGVPSILVSFRHLDTILVAECDSGEITWEYGPGDLKGQHNPTLLENGNILVFDNRLAGTGSRVAEIFPETGEIVWEYEAEDFYSGHISGAQRLLDGNTLICEGATGRIFEVTESGEIAWEHFSPDSAQVFRAYRYDAEEIDWPDPSIFE